MPPDETVDVRAVVAEIERSVARRRAAGEYPDALLKRLSADFHIVRHDEPMEALAHIHMHAAPVSRRPVIGTAIVLAKKVLRRSIAWYVQPVGAQQSLFNLASIRELRALQRRVERLETPWHRPPRAPTTSKDETLLRARVGAILPAVEQSAGPVVLLPGLAGGLADLLLTSMPALRNRLTVVDGDPIEALHHYTGGALSVVIAPATLAMLSAADLLSVVALASSKLAVGGVLIVDAPDSQMGSVPLDPSIVDPAVCRWLHRDTVTLLAEAAGLTVRDIADVAEAWYRVVAVRTAR